MTRPTETYSLPVYQTVQDMRTAVELARRSGKRIALVPTMGALHEGHLALIREATKHGQMVVVSIFVNPLQFGPNEDFRCYPRTLESDIAVARAAGATDVFAPEADELTPPGLQFTVDPGPLAEVLEGEFRPGHFLGVCTIVLKLFNVVQPHSSIFGWKDAQQFILLRRMVEEFNLHVELYGIETIRESNGLALSSRNAYLSPDERAKTPVLYATLLRAREAFQGLEGAGGLAEIRNIEDTAVRELVESGFAVDYVRVVSSNDLTPFEELPSTGVLLAVAARLDTTRLIDNIRW